MHAQTRYFMIKVSRRAITTEVDENAVDDSFNENDDDNESTVSEVEAALDEKDIRRRDYKIEKFTLTADNVNSFIILEDRRQISEGQVRKIHGALLEKRNPIGILVVNRVEGQDRLIDGNHRIEAIKRFFEYKKVYSIIKIDCTLKVYENLNPDEERQVYLDEAKRRNEGLDDRLNMFKKTITFWNLLQDPLNEFPCSISIYPSSLSLKFKTVLNAIATARRLPGSDFSAASLGKDEIITFANDVIYAEYEVFKDFMTLFIKTFGAIEKSNFFTKPQFFTPLYDIYAKNLKFSKEKTFNERFAKIIGRADVMSYKNMNSNRDVLVQVREVMLSHMNKGHSTKEFK